GAVREGVRVPLLGRPNAGKSSLFNALLGEDRAIVAAEPGTTRDRVSERLLVDGVAVTLSDTAGVREATSAVEAMGVARSLAALEDAPVVIWVVDGAAAFDPAGDPLVRELCGRRVLVALTKADLGRAFDDAAPGAALREACTRTVRISAV